MNYLASLEPEALGPVIVLLSGVIVCLVSLIGEKLWPHQ